MTAGQKLQHLNRKSVLLGKKFNIKVNKTLYRDLLEKFVRDNK